MNIKKDLVKGKTYKAKDSIHSYKVLQFKTNNTKDKTKVKEYKKGDSLVEYQIKDLDIILVTTVEDFKSRVE